MTSGSSADTTWTFSGEVAAPAAGESTADDTVVQSVVSSTEDDKAKAPSAAAKVAPKANQHREHQHLHVQHPQVRGRQGQVIGDLKSPGCL